MSAGAVLSMKEVNLNPHLIKRGFFQIIDHGDGVGKRPIPSQIPVKFSELESFVLKQAPRFGEDTEYVLCTLLGMPSEDIKKLEEEKVISRQHTFPTGRPTRTDLIEKQEAGWFDSDYLNELSESYGEDMGYKEVQHGRQES